MRENAERVSRVHLGCSEREAFRKIGRFAKLVAFREEHVSEYGLSYPFSHLSVPLLWLMPVHAKF